MNIKVSAKDTPLTLVFASSKHLATRAVKYQLMNRIIKNLPTRDEDDLERVKYNRSQIMYKKEEGLVDHKGEWTTFGVTMQKIKSKTYKALHINKSDNKAWDAKFIGEGSQDEGGPYRETLTNLIAELYTPHLPLLIPTKNQKSDHGSGRDLWTLNPASTTPTHLEMYRFLGALIGLAVRAGHVIDIKFPSIVWKQFMGEPVTKTDLRSTDEHAVESLSKLQKSKEEVSLIIFVPK